MWHEAVGLDAEHAQTDFCHLPYQVEAELDVSPLRYLPNRPAKMPPIAHAWRCWRLTSTKHEMFGSADTPPRRSEEHTSELQSLMRISYAGFCLKKKNTKN